MSDRSRKTTGLILISAAMLLTILPTLFSRTPEEQRYHASGENAWVLKEIGTEQNGNVRVNEANAAELETLYGIGPAFAGRIIEERQKNGPFHYPEDLEAVNGIGPQTLSKFRTMIDMTTDEGGN